MPLEVLQGVEHCRTIGETAEQIEGGCGKSHA